MKELNLKRADKQKVKITKECLQKIERLYNDIYKDISKRLKEITGSSRTEYLQKMQLEQLKIEIANKIKSINEQLQSVYKEGINEVAQAVIDDVKDYLKDSGLLFTDIMYANVSSEIMSMIVSGDIYNKKWALSDAIWKHTEKAKDDIYNIIAKGYAENKTTLEIAKDLEKYVNPSAAKPWDWSKVYPGVSAKIDYNAQRLARTLIAHAYQEAAIRTTKNNPFITGIKWRSALIHGRTCELCRSRNGQIFKPEELPLDHPNGLCTMILVTMPLKDVGDRLAK